LIPERIATALNVQEQLGQTMLDTLTTYLRRKDILLLLDNVEHIVRESAVITEHLLVHSPKLKILVTGREALFIAGETTLQIPSLSLPEPSQNVEDLDKLAEYEAIQLFLDRARAVRPDFALHPKNATAIVDIVRRLDGIPLALELAAARLRMLTVEKIAERLSDRFRLLTGGRRTGLPRQQTLEALIDWSWQLLDEREHILLQRLSVFSGGWSLEAAEEVCGFEPLIVADVFNYLDQLINKSLVTVEFLPEGEPRYDMLESIRQFARNRLFAAGEGEQLRDRHAAYFVAFTEAADGELYKRDAMKWVRQLRQDLDNIRAVMEWTLEERPDLALRTTGHLRHNQGYWMAYREAETWLRAVIKQTRPLFDSGDGTIDPGDFIKALIAYSFTLVGLGQNLKILDFLDEAIALARQHNEKRLLAFAIGISGFVHTFNMTPEVIREIEEAVQICREHNFLHELAWNLSFLGGIYYLTGTPEKGEPYIEEALQIRLDLGSPRQIATVLETRSGMAWLQGDLVKARDFTLQAIEHLETLGARQNLTMSQSRLAHIHRAAGEFDEAEALYRNTILRWQEHGNIPAVAHQIECFAFIAIGRGNYRFGARLIGAAKAARERLNAPSINPLEIADMKQAMSQLVGAMGEEALEMAMAEGAEVSLDDAVLLALRD
jgi:non-specific serine/threonine protein kinase